MKTAANNLNRQIEIKQRREIVIEEDIDLGRFFELATGDK